MKHRILLLTLFAVSAAMTVESQTLHVSRNGVTYSYSAATVGIMNFGTADTHTLTVGSRSHVLDNAAIIWVDDKEVVAGTVTVNYAGSTATVDIAGDIASYVDATISGANVDIVQSSDVSEATCGEITYVLGGNSSDGSLTLGGSYKSRLELNGLSLTATSGAALNIQNGKRIALSLREGTENTLIDGADGSQKGCIVCKGHLEIKGKGSLIVTGNTAHAIYAKEYVSLKNSTVTVAGAVKDGINCNQYFMMESGSLTIADTGDDGIQVSFKDDTDREADDTGSVSISGSILNVAVSADASKAIKCEGDILISGGDITAKATGDGVYDTTKLKTKASACLGADGNVTITGGTLNLTATGGGGKGINCDGALTINDGTIAIATSGGIVAYVNNTLYTNYTGNTDRLDSDMKSSPKGIKADGNIDINGGNITVTTTGNSAEGIESKSVLTVNNGVINISSTDDAMNSASHMYIKGGTVTVVASGNDGLDSNGNLYIEGGVVMAFGAGAPECGLDANEEEGYTVVFTGGTVLAVGGGNSVPSSSSGSTQPYVTGNGSVSAGATVSLSSSDGTLATFTVPANYKASSNGGSGGGPGGRPGGGPGGSGGNSILITCPSLTNGGSYTLTVGTSTSNVTARLSGSNFGGRP